MAPRGTVDITFRTRGQQQVRATIRGVAQESKKSDRETIASARRVERERAQAARRAARMQITSAQWASREEARLARERTRVETAAQRERVRAQRAADALVRRSQEQLHREQQRRTRAAQRDMRRGQARFDGVLMGAGAMAGGAAIAGTLRAFDALATRLDTIASAVSSHAGALDVGQRTVQAMEFDAGLRRAEFFGDQDPATRAESMAQLRREIEATALATGQMPNDMLEMLNAMQANNSEFESGRRGLRAIADEANRTGASMQDVGAFVGIVNQTLGESAPSAERLFDIMAQQGIRGNVSPEEMARDFMPMLGQFTEASGQTGEEAFRNFTGIAQGIRPAFSSSAEAATGMQALMSELGDEHARERIIRATGGSVRHVTGADGVRRTVGEGGTEAFREDGTVDMLRLVQDLGGVQGVGTTNAIFHNVRARRAFGQLARLDQRDEAGEDVETAAELANADAEAGGRFRTARIAEMDDSALTRARRQAAQTATEGQASMEERAREAEVDNALKNVLERSAIGSVVSALIPNAAMPLAARSASALGTPGGTSTLQMLGGMGGPVGILAQGASGLAGVGTEMNRDLARTRGKDTQRVEGQVELGQRTVDAIAQAFARTQSRTPVPGRTPG